MSDYISINIQECQPTQTIHHSNRSTYISYLITEPNTITKYRHELEYLSEGNLQDEQIKQFFELRTTEIKQDYKDHIKQTMKANTKLYQEAVVSFGREAFERNNLDDIQQSLDIFCNKFEEKYKVKILMSSLHLDEGHKDTQGKIQHNYHAHILIENYSFETHKTGMRKVDYRKLQTELAESFEDLGFKRGDPEKKAQRLEHKQYREAIEQKQAIIHTANKEFEPINELGNQIGLEFNDGKSFAESLQAEVIEPLETLVHHLKPEVAETLENVKQLTTEISKELTEKDKIIAEFKQQINEQLSATKQIEDLYKKAREELKATKQAKQADYQDLKKSFEASIAQIKSGISTLKSEQQQQGKKSYKDEIQEANPRVSKLVSFPEIDSKNRLSVMLPSKSETLIHKALDEIQQKAYEVREAQQIKQVKKIIEKQIEKPVIVDIEEQNRLKAHVDKTINYNLKLIMENNDLETESNKLKEALEKEQQDKAEYKALFDNSYRQFTNQTTRLLDLTKEKKELINQNSELLKENSELKIENKELLTTIERFLELPICKGITNATQSLKTRLNQVFDFLKNKAIAPEPQQPQQSHDNDFCL